MFRFKNVLIGIASSNSKMISLLFCIFCSVEFIIDPVGDFPLNDDWWYAKTLDTFHSQSFFDPKGWSCSVMLSQLIVGKLFVSLFGFSFTVLRFSTLTFSFLGIVFFYLLMENFITKDRVSAFLISLLVFFNPLFLSLSNSFMTDIPFISLLIISLYFYLKYRENQKLSALLFYLLFLTAAVLNRQLGLAFIAGIFISEIIIQKKIKPASVVFFMIPAVSLFVFEFWMNSKNTNNVYTYTFFSKENWADINTYSSTLLNFAKRWVHYISLSGFVLSPILIAYLFNYFKTKTYLVNKKLLLISAILFLPVIWSLKNFPIGNYLYNSGVGPETLLDTYIYRINLAHASSGIIFNSIKLLSFLGSFGLLLILTNSLNGILVERKKGIAFNNKTLVIYISLLLYYFFLSKAGAIFDRYILVFSIFIIPVIFLSDSKISVHSPMFKGLLILMVLFSTFTAKDYLNNNRAKWTAIGYLKKNHIDDEKINAGYEHSGYCCSDSSSWYSKWHNIYPNEFLVTHGPVKNYSAINWINYQRYIPYKKDTIFILRNIKSLTLSGN